MSRQALKLGSKYLNIMALNFFSNKTVETKSKPNTSNFFLGSPEAEAENENSRVPLIQVFDDYLNILPQLEHEKFIIIGRKGAGKSAIAKYIQKKSDLTPNSFVDFANKVDVTIEKLINYNHSDDSFTDETLIRWIILIKFASLINKNEAVKTLKEHKNLSAFLDRNRGFVDIDKYEVEELHKEVSHSIKAEPLRRLLYGLGIKNTFKESKAPFYKLIVPLQEALVELVVSNYDLKQGNQYTLIFDDLDINYIPDDESSVARMMNLIRIVKDFNNEVFAHNGINAKILLLIRDDIVNDLYKKASDSAKILSSYSVYLAWYDKDIYKIDENKTALKKFINKRLEYNFINNGYEYDENDPWYSIFPKNIEDNSRTSFKEILDYTFFKPRDLLIFFEPISKLDFGLPLDKKEVMALLHKYADAAMRELQSELTLFYSSKKIDLIFDILRYIHKNKGCMLSDLAVEFSDESDEILSVLYKLYEYSLIGNITSDKKIYFYHRKPVNYSQKFDQEMAIILHNLVDLYFKNK